MSDPRRDVAERLASVLESNLASGEEPIQMTRLFVAELRDALLREPSERREPEAIRDALDFGFAYGWKARRVRPFGSVDTAIEQQSEGVYRKWLRGRTPSDSPAGMG